jgi:hypothetical protein
MFHPALSQTKNSVAMMCVNAARSLAHSLNTLLVVHIPEKQNDLGHAFPE